MRTISMVAAAISVFGVLDAANAAPLTWTGSAGDGLFRTAGNWSSNTIPGSSDDVTINSGNVTYVPGGDMSVKSFTMNGGSFVQTTSNSWMQFGGRSLSVTGGTFDTGTAASLVRNATTSVSVSGTGTLKLSAIHFGYDPAASGSFSVTGGGTLSAVEFHPTATFTQTGGNVTVKLISFDTGTGKYNLAGGNLELHPSTSAFYTPSATRYLNFPEGSTGVLTISNKTLADVTPYFTNGWIRYADTTGSSAFSVSQSGSNVIVTHVPEPATLAPFAGCALLLRRRRQ